MRHDESSPRLTLTPAAWLKWQFLCHAGPTEVAALGLSAEDDPLTLDDLLVVRQRASTASVEFDDAAVADLFDEWTDAGFPPARFARVWLHTHPGASPDPSRTDERTFARAFGSCDWSVMAILGRTGRTYARLHFAAGPGGAIELPVAVDWSPWPNLATDPARPLTEVVADWRREYETLVTPLGCAGLPTEGTRPDVEFPDPFDDPFFPGGLHAFP